jgi:dipeptidyl aminopeptidase/acylaminoacyl peptidase
MGLSYGGFVTNWLVGTSDRFRAAVSENGVANQVSAWANSDCGPDYCVSAELGDTVTEAGVAALWRQSPLRHVDRIRTPLLILQAEEDLRCPAADAEQLFVALRWLRREVELVLYPEEYHAYQGTGRPDRREDRHARVLDWFSRYLPVSGSADGALAGDRTTVGSTQMGST